MQRDSHSGSFLMINGADPQHQGKSESSPMRLLRNGLFTTLGAVEHRAPVEHAPNRGPCLRLYCQEKLHFHSLWNRASMAA